MIFEVIKAAAYGLICLAPMAVWMGLFASITQAIS